MTESQAPASAGPREGFPGVGTDVPAPAARRGPGSRRSGQRVEIALLSAPAIVMFLTFVVLPVGMAAYYGLYNWHGAGPLDDFAGLEHYRVIWRDPEFHRAVQHTFAIAGLSLLIQGPLALLLALLLNRKVRGRSVIRVLVFAPWVVSEVITATGWGLIVGPRGALNDMLNHINDLSSHLFWGWHVFGAGKVDVDWLGNPHLGLWTLMLVLTWKYLGFAVILMMAGLQNIPDELYEAARVDGASYWQIQRGITLPLLGPTIRIWAFLSIIGSLQLFDVVFLMWQGDLSDVAGTSTMATYMYKYGKDVSNFGYGSAVAVVLFLISLAVALVYQRLVLRRDLGGAVTGGRQAR